MKAINYEKDYNKDFLIKKEALKHAIYKFFFISCRRRQEEIRMFIFHA